MDKCISIKKQLGKMQGLCEEHNPRYNFFKLQRVHIFPKQQ